ncbi:MAG: 3-hydroxyacyl-CoA dehydrogenase NAD-binding domain-containing protein, partial [Pyrinomonadaceae bacterium]
MNETIGVIGAGTMGNGIAQTAASGGFEVVLCDIDTELLERGV